MEDNINVLYLEDNINDFELIISQLNSHFPQCSFTRVETKAAFSASLESGNFNLIISDFSLPNFDGLSALDIKNKIAPQLPFIFISGHIGEDRAIEALKHGAIDYVLKDRPDKLIPAIRRALNEADEKRRRILAEEERNNYITLLNEAQEIGKMGSWETDILTGKTIWSASCFILYGYKPFEVEPTYEFWRSRVLPEDLHILDKTTELINKRREHIEIEHRIVLPDGKTKWILSRMTPTFLDNKFVKLKGINIDITERKLFEQKLLSSELRFRTVWEKSTDGMRVTDENGIVIMANESYCRMTGKSLSEIKGKPFSVVYHESEQQSVYGDYLIKYRSGSIPKYLEGPVKYSDGSEAFVELSNTFLNFPGQNTLVFTVFRDVTERKLMIDQLVIARDKAEAANKLKDAFIANISHEIRTPLNGVIGLTSILQDLYSPYMKDDDEEIFEGIKDSSNRLKRTVDMILNYSRLQTDTFTINKKMVDLCGLCKKIIDSFASLAKSKNIKLFMECELQEALIFGDEYTINDSITGLIDNALKFTDEGFIKLTLSLDKDNVLLKLIDTGIGISADKIDSVFEPYIQEDMGYGRRYEGVGLGLSIVKKYLQLNGASISVQSDKNSGTTFTINFGQRLQSHENEKTIVISPVKPVINSCVQKTILVVEDERINQLALKKLLENKYKICLAADALTAKEILNNNDVGLILMDISLKGDQHGLSLTSELKNNKRFSHIPIIVVTAHALSEDKKNSMDVGADDYLAKPYTNFELLNKISLHLKSSYPDINPS